MFAPRRLAVGSHHPWEERFYTPPPPGGDFRDCKCARIETKASIHSSLGAWQSGAIILLSLMIIMINIHYYTSVINNDNNAWFPPGSREPSSWNHALLSSLSLSLLLSLCMFIIIVVIIIIIISSSSSSSSTMSHHPGTAQTSYGDSTILSPAILSEKPLIF